MAVVKTVVNMGAYIGFKRKDIALYAMPELRQNTILKTIKIPTNYEG